jgi:hypothetical protein
MQRFKNGDQIFMAHIHPERQEHVVWATSTISQWLSEAFSKNSEKQMFHDLVPKSLHNFEDVFNKESLIPFQSGKNGTMQ